MSFMFKPYRFTDPRALNRPEIPAEITAQIVMGNDAVAKKLIEKTGDHRMLVLDGYIGAAFDLLYSRIIELAEERSVILFDVSEAYKSAAELECMLADSLPENREIDPILLFGKTVFREVDSLFDPERSALLTEKLASARKKHSLVILHGFGSTRFHQTGDIAAFVDVTPMEATLRIREHRVCNLGDSGKRRSLSYIFRRMYYYDYEIAMLHRQILVAEDKLDFYIDGNMIDRLKMLPLKEFKEILELMLQYPLRCTPVYLEGVWGGTFIKKLRRLPDDMRNCAWVFDMIPNEVSLQIKAGKDTLNIPFSTFFKEKAESLMGKESVSRFGRVFPIRFNYDDTYGGSGNMSIQVHPPQAYNQEHFGEPFQQDESYYCVKTAGSRTYIGLQDDCDVDEFFRCIDRAEKEHIPFDYEKYVNSFPSTEGDQFLLPGGTIHASGRNQVVLEIGSYTIGSYTFKLYDYLRLDLDGVPRPIHSIHGKNVLVSERRRSRIDGVLRSRPVTVRSGEGWKEEIIGEHELMYFSLRRLSFERSIVDDTRGEKFHVLVLVEGDEILICARQDPSRFYHARYLDMVVIPAQLGEYEILNLGGTSCKVTKTMLK